MVGRTGLTYESFAATAEEMLLLGLPLTYKSLRERLESGSNTTIGTFLDQWRKSKAENTVLMPSSILPAPILSALQNWVDAQMTSVIHAGDLRSKELILQREFLETEADSTESKYLEEKIRGDAFEIENHKLAGRIAQLEADNAAEKIEKSKIDGKLLAARSDLAVASEKLTAALSNQEKSDSTIQKLESELSDLRELERFATDAANKFEVRLEGIEKLISSMEERARDQERGIIDLQQRNILLQDALNDAEIRARTAETVAEMARSNVAAVSKWKKLVPSKAGKFRNK